MRAGSWSLVTAEAQEAAPTPCLQQTSSGWKSVGGEKAAKCVDTNHVSQDLLESNTNSQWCTRSLWGWLQGKLDQMLFHVSTDFILAGKGEPKLYLQKTSAQDLWEEIRNQNLVDKLKAWPKRKWSKTQQRQLQAVQLSRNIQLHKHGRAGRRCQVRT